ncbi:MAG: methyltransferase domain-containing protein [Planctomycetes bacterium]|nr:methyltransferase domain-containing protein [Planctomycetota bacterium]
MRNHSVWILSLSLFLLWGCAGGQPEREEQAERGHDDGATVHRRFDDAEVWAGRFEDPGRDAWQRPQRVLELLRLKPDARVADVGAATGYFPVRFAAAVPRGVVYGVDVEPTLVNYLSLRAHREGLSNLIALVCQPDDPCLPEPVDLVFVCDTYHHIGARVDYFTRLKQSLRPGGRLAIVDFRPGDFPVGPKDPHKLPAEAVIAELAKAGYALTLRNDELPYQYVLVFAPR